MIAAGIIFALVIFNGVSAFLYFHLGWFRRFYHDILGWHIPDDHVDEHFNGRSFHCVCKHCGKEIMQDSQGNWY